MLWTPHNRVEAAFNGKVTRNCYVFEVMISAMMFAALCIKSSSRVFRHGLACAVLLLIGMPWAHAYEPVEVDDLATRMQYAFLTRDQRALLGGIEELRRLSVSDEGQVWREYQLGVGYWHLAELSSEDAELNQWLKGCEEHLAAAARLRPALVEAQALSGFCAFQRTAARAANGRGIKRECSRQADVAQALERAPRNPRVRYVSALCALQDGDAAAALQHAQRAWSEFEQTRIETEEHRIWGHAETCVLLARLELQHGNRTVARDRAEQALVLAPDYVAARELLDRILMGS
jgi:uncharacterized protein YecT (DUF1311 family)